MHRRREINEKDLINSNMLSPVLAVQGKTRKKAFTNDGIKMQ